MITRQFLAKRQLAVFTSQSPVINGRLFSTSASQSVPSSSTPPTTKPHTIDPKWLTVMKGRIGKCMMFGLQPDQVQKAGSVLRQLARDWRELVAGSEGYLTDEKRRGLFRHNVVWGEMDVMKLKGHVNNVTYVRYAETARVNWSRNLGIHIDPAHKKEWLNILNSTGIGLILKSIKVDYKFPMMWPDKISVYHKLVQDPSPQASTKSSFELHVMIVSEAHQRPAARCYEDIVTYDYKLGRKTQALPPFMIDQFKAIWELQEKAKGTWQQRIIEIESQVRTLELESWDREGAVEDLGSAAKR